jgi:hypothetical protein
VYELSERRCECGCRRIDFGEEKQTSYIRSLRALVRQRKDSACASYSSRRSHLRSSLNRVCGFGVDERHALVDDTKQASSMVAWFKQTNPGKVSFDSGRVLANWKNQRVHDQHACQWKDRIEDGGGFASRIAETE